MNLIDTAQLLGNFGEFVGAIAVVATLAYLAVQIRQNTKSAKALTYTATSTGWQDLLLKLSEADLDIFIQLSVNHHELSHAQFMRAYSFTERSSGVWSMTSINTAAALSTKQHGLRTYAVSRMTRSARQEPEPCGNCSLIPSRLRFRSAWMK